MGSGGTVCWEGAGPLLGTEDRSPLTPGCKDHFRLQIRCTSPIKMGELSLLMLM